MKQMGTVFISYRRSDSEDITDRIYEHLSNYFGKDYFFKDIDSIPPAVNFNDFITTSIKSADAMVVVIGKRWIDATDSQGNRRLDDPTDLVRTEIETGLSHGIPIIPVLVGGSQMPSKDVLPESLRRLADFNAIPVRRNPDFPNDILRLRRVLSDVRKKQLGTFSLWPLGRLHLMLLLLVLIVGSVWGIWWWRDKTTLGGNRANPSPGDGSPELSNSNRADPSPGGGSPELSNSNRADPSLGGGSPELSNSNNVAHSPLQKPYLLTKSHDATYIVRLYEGRDPDLKLKLVRDGCVCYIEQHLNAIDRPQVGGTSVFVSSDASSYTKKWGKWYVDTVAREFSVLNRGISDDISPRFKNLKLAALRLESLFISNPQEAEWIRSKEGQSRLAAILVDSIWRFFPAGGTVCLSTGHAGDPYRPEDGLSHGASTTDGGPEAAYSHMILLKVKRLLEEQR